jgi:hypothetical protein
VEQLPAQGVPLDDVSIVLNLENETTVTGFVTAADTAKEGVRLGALFGKIMEKKCIPKYEQHLKDRKYLVVVQSSPDRLERIRESMQGTAASEVETEAAAAA